MIIFVYLSMYLVSLKINVLTVSGILIQAVISGIIGILAYWLFGCLLRIEELEYFHIKIQKFLDKVPSADTIDEEIS